MRKKSEHLVLAGMLQKLAPKIGAKVLLEPEWKIAGQITFRGGKKSYFRYNTLDLNPVGASDIAKDKDYANFFMRTMGYRTIPGKTFFSDDWCEAIGSKRDASAGYRYAKKLGFPVIVKPAWEGSSKGITKRCLVDTSDELTKVARDLARDYTQPILVEEFIDGDELTVGIIGNERPDIVGIMRVLPTEPTERFVYSLEVKRDWRRLVRYECPAELKAEDRRRLVEQCRNRLNLNEKIADESRRRFERYN